MAYCPKCGVEVENTIRECPLCKFPIPDITEKHHEETVHMEKYPEARNIYREYMLGIKSRIYFVIIVVLVCAIAVLTTISIVFDVHSKIIEFLLYTVISLIMYSFFALGFMRWSINITGMGLTTLFLTYSISLISGEGWFWSYGVPLIIWVYLNALVFHYMYMHSKRRNRLGYLPTFALLIISSLCLGVDGILNMRLTGSIGFSWSLIVTICCLGVAYILHAIINHLPQEMKDLVKRRLHM